MRRIVGRIVAGWIALALAACGDSTGPGFTNAPSTPDGAVFVTTDITNFWAAYDAGGSAGSGQVFQQQYLDRASPGLRDFVAARNVTASSLVQMVTAFSRYFRAVRTNMLRLAQSPAVIDRIRESYENIEALYPEAVYPPVTFLVGRFSTGGTIRQSGILIGTEFYAVEDTTPLAELTPFARNNVKPLDSLPLIVAHEHVHVLQVRAGNPFGRVTATLLEQSLMEGSADFIGELVSGSHVNHHVHAYGLQHEADLWIEFQLAMNGGNISEWLYNQGSATPGGRPGDLGYFIGYRITRAFFLRQTNQAAAVKAIIEMRNASNFLAASGYDP